MNDLISIIVPVYNVEKYLEKCVVSLCRQTYKNIEIILIDDGSTDSSGKMSEAFAASDNRIVVLHQENAGVSAARNHGLKIMKGNYITFVDSDDYVAETFIECLYNAIITTGADISTCGHYRVNFDGNTTKVFAENKISNNIKCTSGYQSIIDMFYGRTCSASSGSKLYPVKYFRNVEFPPFIMGEDTFVVYHCLSSAKKVAHTLQPLYYYVQHRGSVTNSKQNYIKFYDYVKLYDYIMIHDKNLDDKNYYRAIANRLIENNFWVYMKLRNCPNMYKEEKKHIEKNIAEYRRHVTNNPEAQRRVRIACMLSYFGMNLLNKIYDNIDKK